MEITKLGDQFSAMCDHLRHFEFINSSILRFANDSILNLELEIILTFGARVESEYAKNQLENCERIDDAIR